MRSSFIAVIAALWAAATGGCVAEKTPRLSATPQRALYDRPVSIVIDRAPPGKAVRVIATTQDRTGRTWQSEATFTADKAGRVDLSTTTPVAGSYKKADGMGFFWSMTPEGVEDPSGSFFQWPRDNPLAVTLRVEAEGREPVETTLERLGFPENVEGSPVRDRGLVTVCFRPKGPQNGNLPGLLVLGGSEGGIPTHDAALLASRGYVTLAVAYFQARSLPEQLVEIPLDYVASAVRWLREQPGIDAGRIGVMGGSKGAELALLLAAEHPEWFRAVVASAPAAVVFPGIYKDGRDYRKGLRSSWSRDGRPVPFADSSPGFVTILKLATGQPGALRSWYAQILKDAAAVEKASIPVERIQAPILLLAGTDDQVWPSAEMAEMIVERRKRHKTPWPDESCRYVGAGHAIVMPYFPTCCTRFGWITLGGTPEANAAAGEAAHKTLLRFLERHLGTE